MALPTAQIEKVPSFTDACNDRVILYLYYCIGQSDCLCGKRRHGEF